LNTLNYKFRSFRQTQCTAQHLWRNLREELLALLVLTILCVPAYATTWIVQHEPGGHFVRVQDAIDGSSHGDTILVEPGTYYENINFNGKNVVLTSRYLFTEDETYINNTILDGNNFDRVVTIENGEPRTTQLIGFTIQRGNIVQTSSEPVYTYGAGIQISGSSPSIINCTIKNNNAGSRSYGAGIGLDLGASPLLSGLSIHNNHAATAGGGIMMLNTCSPQFDALNKCSVYNNSAGFMNDIYIAEHYPHYILIPLDTFSVAHVDEHFIGLPTTLTLTIEHGYFEPVTHDLYVSPDGDDSNSGVSFDDPIKSIQYALSMIESDSLNPHTIYLNAGTFAPSTGQYFPINTRNYISIRGAGKDLTILDGENIEQLIIARYDNYYSVSNLTIHRSPYEGSYHAITITENIEAVYRNIRLTENDGVINMIGSSAEELPQPSNSSILLDSLSIINNICRWTMYLKNHNVAVFQNSVIHNSQPVYDEELEININYPLQLRYGLPHQVNPSIAVRNVEISNNANMDAFYAGIATGIYINRVTTKLINCTIADNRSQTGGAITLFNAKATIVNSIIYNNNPNQFYLYNPLSYSNDTLIVQNCIVETGEYGIHQQGENTVHWLENNLDVDPWFQGGDTNPYHLTENSPAIDAGTAFFVWEGDTIVNMSPDEYSGLAPDIGAYEYHEPDGLDGQIIPVGFELYPNFPNPFNGSTQISFSIPIQNDVDLTIYNIKGQQIEHQTFESLEAGTHRIKWDAKNLPSGLYLYEIETGDVKLSGKALLVK